MEENLAATEKSNLRNRLNSQRAERSYHPDHASSLNVHLAELCLINGVAKIACYLPFGNEPDTELFIDWALENNIRVLLPVSKPDGRLDWVNFDGRTQIGIFGFQEAVGDPELPKDIDLAIVPALAVDKTGTRLGKGKGFYDRALQSFDPLPPVVAVVFEDEILDAIPAEAHDQSVDAAVTPSGITHFNQRLK